MNPSTPLPKDRSAGNRPAATAAPGTPAPRPEPGADLLPEQQPNPGPMPTDGEPPREILHRAKDDVESGRQDTDAAGMQAQRHQAPSDASTRRTDGR